MADLVATVSREVLTQVLAQTGGEASHVTLDSPAPSRMSVSNGNGADATDPNKVFIHVTDSALTNRITIPREIFIKSKRDSYEHPNVVNDPARSYVVINGKKVYQTSNQGRSSKIQASFFNATRAGQTLVLMREKGNIWVSSIRGGKVGAAVAPANKGTNKGRVGLSLAAPVAKGKSAGRFQVAQPQAVAPPKAKTQPKVQTQKAGSSAEQLQAALRLAVKQINENAKNGFTNASIELAAARRNSQTPRMYLTTAQNKALKAVCEDNGKSILDTDAPLRKYFKWAE